MKTLNFLFKLKEIFSLNLTLTLLLNFIIFSYAYINGGI